MKTKHRMAAHAKRKYQADPGSIYKLMARVQPFTEAEQATLIVPVREAWERIRTGHAQDGDFDTLAACANVCLLRAEDIDQLLVDTVQHAQQALIAMLERHNRTGRWGVDHLTLQHMPDLLNIYDQLIALSTPQQMRDAMQTTIKRMRAGEVLEVNV